MLTLEVLIATLLLGFLYLGLPLIYIVWMRRIALTRPWNLKIDKAYAPKVTILLPTYNEEKVITKKLENIMALDYPNELVEVILIDSASEDATVSFARSFLSQHSNLKAKILEESERAGKTKAMNVALNEATGEVIVTTDADTYWSSDTLRLVTQFLSDPSVGAVTGTEAVMNPGQSETTRLEVSYRDAFDFMHIGESKIHSTLIFSGELSAFKRQFLERFDDKIGSDDTSAAISIAAKGLRCIQIPEAKYYENVYHTLNGEATVKLRRAQQMVQIWLSCLRSTLSWKGGALNRVILANTYLHVFNPLIGPFFYVTLTIAIIQQPFLLLLLLPVIIVPKIRRYASSFVMHNFYLIGGIFQLSTGKKQIVWKKVQENRKAFSLNADKIGLNVNSP